MLDRGHRTIRAGWLIEASALGLAAMVSTFAMAQGPKPPSHAAAAAAAAPSLTAAAGPTASDKCSQAAIRGAFANKYTPDVVTCEIKSVMANFASIKRAAKAEATPGSEPAGTIREQEPAAGGPVREVTVLRYSDGSVHTPPTTDPAPAGDPTPAPAPTTPATTTSGEQPQTNSVNAAGPDAGDEGVATALPACIEPCEPPHPRWPPWWLPGAGAGALLALAGGTMSVQRIRRARWRRLVNVSASIDAGEGLAGPIAFPEPSVSIRISVEPGEARALGPIPIRKAV